jgi:hypothetical protein
MSTLRKALILALYFAGITMIAGLSYAAPWERMSWRPALLGAGSLGCFGFLLGGIFAFDPESGIKITSSAVGRVSFGIAASLILSVLWRWPPEGVVLASLIGAMLGYLGMSWARHVHF